MQNHHLAFYHCSDFFFCKPSVSNEITFVEKNNGSWESRTGLPKASLVVYGGPRYLSPKKNRFFLSTKNKGRNLVGRHQRCWSYLFLFFLESNIFSHGKFLAKRYPAPWGVSIIAKTEQNPQKKWLFRWYFDIGVIACCLSELGGFNILIITHLEFPKRSSRWLDLLKQRSRQPIFLC